LEIFVDQTSSLEIRSKAKNQNSIATRNFCFCPSEKVNFLL